MVRIPHFSRGQLETHSAALFGQQYHVRQLKGHHTSYGLKEIDTESVWG